MNIGVLASHEGSTLQVVLDACAERRIPGRVAVVISNNSGAHALEPSQAGGARAFPYRQQILKETYRGHHPKEITKIDIFWFDDVITIDKPLRSFGGDIIPFANVINS